MTAIAAITLSQNSVAAYSADDTTFDAVVLSPAGFTQPGIAKWVDRSGGSPIAYPSLTVSVRQPNKASRICRVQAKVVLPVLEDGVSPPVKAYDVTANIEFLLPERSTLAVRKRLASMVMSALATSVYAGDGSPNAATGSPLVPAIYDFDPPY